MAIASFLALAFGFAAAGYAEVLPAPLQRMAYQILGFAGVPDARGLHAVPRTSGSPGRGSSHPTTVRSVSPSSGPGAGGRPGSPGHGSHSPRRGSPSPKSPSPTSPGRITITAAHRQIVAGGSARILASLAPGGQPEPDVRLILAERPAGQVAWRQVASGTTGPRGELVLTVPSLTTNASFLVTGPHGARSPELSIIVVPPLSLTAEHGHGHSDVLLVSAPLAQSRDVVDLEVAGPGGSWRLLRAHRLRGSSGAKGTVFTVVARKASLTYRVLLLATPLHAESVSRTVAIATGAPRGGGGGKQG